MIWDPLNQRIQSQSAGDPGWRVSGEHMENKLISSQLQTKRELLNNRTNPILKPNLCWGTRSWLQRLNDQDLINFT